MRLPFPVVLASASPRRRQLLATQVPQFEIHVSDVDEESLTTEDPFETAERLAHAKAKAVAIQRPNALVIGGDTVVTFRNGDTWIQVAKPRDPEDAHRMLQTLSGRTHMVATGLALIWPGGEWVGHERTEVRFRDLSDAEIAAYVATGEPMDKAGAYGLQDGSHDFVPEISGSRTNVIGLPMELLVERLKAL